MLTWFLCCLVCLSGIASWYGKPFHGRKTASGSVYNMHKLVVAHRWLPFGTKLRLRNLRNTKECIVTVVDRGPFKEGRILDVSLGTAKALGFVKEGLTEIRADEI